MKAQNEGNRFHVPPEGTTHPGRDKVGSSLCRSISNIDTHFWSVLSPPAAGLKVWGRDMSKKSLAQNPDGHKTCCGEQNEVSSTELIAYSGGDGGIRKQPDQY